MAKLDRQKKWQIDVSQKLKTYKDSLKRASGYNPEKRVNDF